MTNGKPNLLPCPFCGGGAIILGGYRHSPVFVHCVGCKTDSCYYDTEEEAAAAWNRRAVVTDEQFTVTHDRRTWAVVK